MTIETEVANLTTQTTALLNAVNVSKATLDQKATVATEQAAIATTKATEAATSAALALQAKNDAAATFAGATIQNGLALVTIQGEPFALLPVDANGDAIANIAHRTGLLSSLLTLPGINGEVGVATDTKSLVVFTGVEGQAIELRAIGRVNAAGTNSLTLGNNAMTSNAGVEAVALGANARGTIMGETAIGSSIPGVQRRLVSLAYRTTDAEYMGLTTDGLASGSGNSPRLEKAGFYDVDVVLMGRQIGTNNFLRQHRRCVLRWAGGGTSPTKLFETTPTADVNTTLGAYGLTLGGVAGGYIDVSVEGLAGTTIQWAAYLDIRELSITV